MSGNLEDWQYLAEIKNISNMYPYGKSYGATAIYNADNSYGYGFNGMEKADELDEGVLDFGARIYNSDCIFIIL